MIDAEIAPCQLTISHRQFMMSANPLAQVDEGPDDLELTSPLDDHFGRIHGHGLAIRRQAVRWMGDGQPVTAPNDTLGRR
jgi:hypothetical protein